MAGGRELRSNILHASCKPYPRVPAASTPHIETRSSQLLWRCPVLAVLPTLKRRSALCQKLTRVGLQEGCFFCASHRARPPSLSVIRVLGRANARPGEVGTLCFLSGFLAAATSPRGL